MTVKSLVPPAATLVRTAAGLMLNSEAWVPPKVIEVRSSGSTPPFVIVKVTVPLGPDTGTFPKACVPPSATAVAPTVTAISEAAVAAAVEKTSTKAAANTFRRESKE